MRLGGFSPPLYPPNQAAIVLFKPADSGRGRLETDMFSVLNGFWVRSRLSTLISRTAALDCLEVIIPGLVCQLLFSLCQIDDLVCSDDLGNGVLILQVSEVHRERYLTWEWLKLDGTDSTNHSMSGPPTKLDQNDIAFVVHELILEQVRCVCQP